MKFCSNILRSFITVTLALFFFSGASEARPYPNNYDVQQVVPRTITVDKLGRGDFASVQQALDSIPSNNSVWTRIYIKSGTYVEQIEIPREKPYIILEGDPNDHFTVIESGLYGGDVEKSPTFTLHADNFVAKNIVFKNTYNRVPPPKNGHGRKMTQAPAVSIHGDKASFYRCSFLSLQDTLGDIEGRHYFYDCYIQGLVDFIWGFGQSIYEKCHIDSLGSGSITAQGRDGENKPDGFVFKDCYISGSGRPTKLGRAYRPYARVLFVRTYMEDIIDPLGWEAPWNNGKYDLTAFSEVDCKGPGADISYRVPWEKKQLSAEEVSYFSNAGSFINKDGWMEKQPK
ncbi:probable pectinesterase 55 [Argentina anserina]|uniref:probable pectinesterase 55 n=1 Tax=Argentina anserina TaxID=57926 RepID=UPI0021764A14|nr:probable pectinesterase 55 [Potentilla anserina]